MFRSTPTAASGGKTLRHLRRRSGRAPALSHAAPSHSQLTHADLVALRRIYFSDRLYSEEELPPEFKLFLPIQVRIRSIRFALFPPHPLTAVRAALQKS